MTYNCLDILPYSYGNTFGFNGGEVRLDVHYDSSDRWALTTDGEIELSSFDYHLYSSLWEAAFQYIFANKKGTDIFLSNKLIVGGGDLQVADILSRYGNSRYITVVDPLTRHIQKLIHPFMAHNLDDYNIVSSLFQDYDNYHSVFDIVCIDLSDEYLNIAQSFYGAHDTNCKLYSRLNDNGLLVAYAANGSLVLDDKMLKLVAKFSAHIPTYFDTMTEVHVYEKIV